jgi:WD40 repeat protein
MWVRTRSDSEKRQAGRIMLWSCVPGVILAVTLFILGLPSTLWTPKGARGFVSGVICALLFAISGMFLLGAAVFIEDSEVRSHHKGSRPGQPIINPAGPLLPLYSLAGVVAMVVILGRYFYLLLIFVPPPLAPLSDTLLTLDMHSSTSAFIAFAPNGTTVVSRDAQTLKLWEIKTGALKQTLNWNDSGTVLSVAFPAEGSKLAVASSSNMVTVWNISTGKFERTFSFLGHSRRVHSVAFSPDARTMASVNEDGSLNVWDFSSGDLKQTISAIPGELPGSVAFSPDGKTLATWHEIQSLKLWDADNGTLIRNFKGDGCHPRGVVFSPGGKKIVCFTTSYITGDATEIWDAESGTLKRQSTGNSVTVNNSSYSRFAISHDGRTLATSPNWENVEIVDVETGKVKRVVESGLTIASIAFSPNDKRLAIEHYNGTVEIWRLE